jgi:hypothetical protein
MLHLLLLVLAQGAVAPRETAAPGVRVPAYPNPACPIMGKPISTKLYAETDHGRIWVCCKSCIVDIQADVPTAHASAWPSVERRANEVCPVTGKAIVEDSPRVVLQGFEFPVLDAKAAARARVDHQATLAKLLEPALEDVGNATCPVSDLPVVANQIVVIGTSIVRVADARALEPIQADPAAVLAKARRLRAQEDAARAAEEQR